MWQITIAALCIFTNAIFVATEFSLLASRQDKLVVLQANKVLGASTAVYVKKHMPIMLSGCQLGVTLCSILLGVIVEPYIGKECEKYFHLTALGFKYTSFLSLILSLAIIVFLHMFLGEMVPKNIALIDSEKSLLYLAGLLKFFAKFTEPIISFYLSLTYACFKVCGVSITKANNTLSAQQLAMLIDESHEAGLMDASEFIRLHHVLDLQEKRVADIAVPLEQMHIIHGETLVDGKCGLSINTVQQIIRNSGFSRYPVVDEHGTLRGYVHVKDLLQYLLLPSEVSTQLSEKDTISTRSTHIFTPLIRPMVTFSEHTTINTVVAALRKHNSHMAQIISDQNELLGIVALDDIVKLFVDSARNDTNYSPIINSIA